MAVRPGCRCHPERIRAGSGHVRLGLARLPASERVCQRGRTGAHAGHWLVGRRAKGGVRGDRGPGLRNPGACPCRWRRPRIWRRTVALTDEAIDKIKQMIISGRVRPGEKLPREADLAAELGLSRNSLREAVKALSLINVLDVRQGDGTYATSLAPSLLLEALSFIVDFHRDDTVLDFLEVRRILEPAATALAAIRMPDEDRIELGKVLDAADASMPMEEFVATDLEFHKKIAAGAANSVLASLVDNMSLPTVRARVWRGMTETGAQERTLGEHRAIYRAIMNRDADLARSCATIHIAGIESWLRTALAD